ncbi:hypothetical protein BsWGS_05669 [Bradybaena similaris]
MPIASFGQILCRLPAVTSYTAAVRGLSTTACVCKNRKSGIPKITPFRTKPLTYEQAQAPYNIYVRKGWLSWNTSNLYEEGRRGETIFEDFLIRKFMFGTWHTNLTSEVVIKRRYNVITLSFLVAMDKLLPRQVYFLQGYTEELLSNWLKCPVKVELQTVDSFDDVIFKKI